MPDYVSKEFNNICWDAGVQCTVTMDPSDFRKQFQFHNVGKHEVELTHDKAVYVLRPGEKMWLKTRGEEPRITKWFVFYQRALA